MRPISLILVVREETLVDNLVISLLCLFSYYSYREFLFM